MPISQRRIVLTAPSVEPVSLAEAKEQLRIDNSDSDTEIGLMISAARDAAEQFCNRYFAQAEIGIIFDSFPQADNLLFVPLPDLVSVDSITYLDDDNSEQSETGFSVLLSRHAVAPADAWPQESSLPQVNVTAGPDIGGSPAGYVPPAVKNAILLILSDLYEHRTSQVDFTLNENMAVVSMLMPYRVEMGV